MGVVNLNGSNLGTSLRALLMADDIEPGSEPSYQLCKTIYLAHPLGAKIAESPIAMAQSQAREISIAAGPEDRVRAQFLKEWEACRAERHIFNVMRLARVYGIAALALVSDGTPTDRPIDYKAIALGQAKIAFNVLDPLNTAGSLVLSQDPNSVDYQHVVSVSVQGKKYHPSRTCVMMNEDPIYIAYTTSAFGYVGRSTYQRALFPLKSFVQSLITDDMVSRKAGVLIAKMKPAGSIIDNVMSAIAGIKRQLLKEAQTDNVISISPEEAIETLNLQNLEGAYGMARKNILENIAVSADMPAKLLNSETFAEGFGEGTEDAKAVARYIDRIRVQMQPLYAWFDKIVQYRAWTPEFFATMQAEFPEHYGNMGYTQAFFGWQNSYAAVWPNLLTEPESDLVKTEKVKLEAISDVVAIMGPMLDPENKVRLLQWAADNISASKRVFSSPLEFDAISLAEYEPPAPGAEEGDGEDAVADGQPRRSGDMLVALAHLRARRAARGDSADIVRLVEGAVERVIGRRAASR